MKDWLKLFAKVAFCGLLFMNTTAMNALPSNTTGADGFVKIKGGILASRDGGPRADNFEMAEHPVTNAEYKLFVDATGHAAPLHWERGRIPQGIESHPVIFVNRYDVAAYLAWRTKKEKRVYQLPTWVEFEYAARAGRDDAVYPWGDESPQGRANFDMSKDEEGDAAEGRRFDQWRKYLKPVKSYPPNAWGLYGMAGNVWQMVDTYPDPVTARWKYRIYKPMNLEGSVVGGSWARGEYYLQCEVRAGASSGIRHPDIGFRVVREPEGETHFHRQVRRLVALPQGEGKVFLSWQLLAGDTDKTGFHVYRSLRRDAAGERRNRAPIRTATNFVDYGVPAGRRVFYRVRSVDANRKKGPPSEWVGVNSDDPPTGLAARFEPTGKKGEFVPVFGDLDGDGLLDVVLRLNNGIREMSRDPGVPVELEAFTGYGRFLWRRPLVWHDHCFGSANNVPVAVYDLDGDGKAEVIARVQLEGEVYLAVLDGMTGQVLRKTPWPEMESDFSRSSTRIHLSVAYLDGKTPGLVTQTGLYENEVFTAYDRNLKQLWEFKSLAETNGSGSHRIEVADVDGDGRDEILNGTTMLNSDGTVRWSIYRAHPDVVAVRSVLPNSKKRQVFYAVESYTHAGAYLVDADSGKIIWKINREDDPRWEHAHMGWVADIWKSSPGMEMLTNRDGHTAQDQVLLSAEGKILLNPFPPGWTPVNWTGGEEKDLISHDGRKLGRFTGKGVEPIAGPGPNASASGGGRCRMVADLVGDFRDEVICFGTTEEGNPALFIYTNTEPIIKREVTRTSGREYRLWMARNMSGGYPSYFEWEPGW